MTAIILDLLWVTILLTHVLVQVADMFSLDILQKYVLQFAEFQEVLYLLGYCLFLIDLILFLVWTFIFRHILNGFMSPI